MAPIVLALVLERGAPVADAQVVPAGGEVPLDTLQHPAVRYEVPAAGSPLRAFGLGRSVAEAGRVRGVAVGEGAGAPDLLVSADGSPGEVPGRVWIVYGGQSPPSTTQSLFALDPAQGIEIRSGFSGPDRFGAFVDGAGDVNGDGYDDFLIGAPSSVHPQAELGGVYLVFGGATLPDSLDLRDLRRKGLLFEAPEQQALLGLVGAGIGDVNGDGVDDFALGIPDAMVTGRGGIDGRRGRVVVVFGSHRLALLSDVDRPVYAVDRLEPPMGLVIDGAIVGSSFGRALAALGDIDGDGADDFAIGAPRHGPVETRGGAAFIVFGGAHLDGGPPDLTLAATPNVLRITTSNLEARLGSALAGGNDVTGDGIPDLAVGAPTATRESVAGVGLVAVIPGGPGLRASPSRDLFDGSIVLWGQRLSEAGASVALVPDRNGDGVAELLAGAPGLDERRGRVYLAHGGESLENGILLEEIAAAGGVIFSHFGLEQPGQAQLGRSVAGLADRDGDGRGEVVAGAPGFRPGRDGSPPEGAVYEVFAGESSDGPRDLNCRVLSQGRVRLAWSLARSVRRLDVLRADGAGDFVAVATLPGDILVWVDAEPGRGEHRYVVEADGDPRLRSNPCAVEVLALAVRELRCEREAATTRVRVSWIPSDDDFLQVKVNGSVVPGLESLPPSTTSVVLELRPQEPDDPPYRIEVCSRDEPEAACARCSVAVTGLSLPPLAGLTCQQDALDPRRVRLDWTLQPEYDLYEVFRGGVLIARLDGRASTYVDAEAPPFGELRYAVRGLAERFHPGPLATCTVVVVPDDAPRIAGRVVYDDTVSTSVRRGVVSVYSVEQGGALVGRGSVNENGEFIVLLRTASGVFDVEFRAEFLLAREGEGVVELPVLLPGGDEHAGGVLRASASGVNVNAGAGASVELRVPLPILAVSPQRSGLERWRSLQARLVEEERSLLFVSATSGGLARGANHIAADLALVRRLLASQFGGAPREVDMVAYGFAGLAARLYVHTAPRCEVRRLVLLGAPNLGTPRALVEVLSDAGVRPDPHGIDAPADLSYKAADEQTKDFLELFNTRVTKGCGTVLHLIAGLGGTAELDGVLGCELHDGRVCLESALGAEREGDGEVVPVFFPGAHLHAVAEDHVALGQSAESLAVLLEEIGLGRPIAGPIADELEDGGGGGARLVLPDDGDRDGDGAGAGIAAAEGLSLGKVTHGEIPPGGSGSYFFASDTSGSIIIILNSDDDGALEFRVRTPAGALVTSANAGSNNASYLSYNDGEGNLVQTYRFLTGQVGTYEVTIASYPENPVIQYTLEFRLDSPIKLKSELLSPDIDLGATTTLVAELENRELLRPGLVLATTARVTRPDGSLLLVGLRDDGAGGDEVGGDGVYSADLPASTQPGYHVIEVQASDAPQATFERAATLQLLVRSDLAVLHEDFDSGADAIEDPADGGQGEGGGAGAPLNESLWVRGSLESTRGGSVVVLGSLTDLRGNRVAQAGTIFSLATAQGAAFRLDFDGYEIFGSRMDGPYVLRDVEILDVGVGFVRADLLTEAHTTDPFSWRDFSVVGGLPFVRGDANNDRAVDLSDAISILVHLFGGAAEGMPGGEAAEITCLDATDANDDARIDLSDAVEVVNYLFLGVVPRLAYPFPECGQDQELGCEYYPFCR